MDSEAYILGSIVIFRVSFVSAVLGCMLLLHALFRIFLVLPDEASQGPVYRILFFHVPAWWTAFVAIAAGSIASIAYLVRRNLRWDSAAVAATEAALPFLLIGITLGSIWGRVAWGIWWTWDARLTSALICVLLYAAYLVLRNNIDDATQRARVSAVFSLFALCDVPIVWYSIRWWRTQHPQPMQLPPDMMQVLLQSWAAILLLTLPLILVRYHQAEVSRQIAALRMSHHEVMQ